MPHTTIRTALPFLFALCLVLLSACQPATRPSPDARPPLLILVSIDGFRADYLDQELTPTLWQLAQTGVHAEAMRPAFPSLTFPNHYSLVTGLVPDHHGIVNNMMRDPDIDGQRFTLEQPWSLLLLDDARVIHESTPIQPDGEGGGHRDTLVLTWRAGGFQGDD